MDGFVVLRQSMIRITLAAMLWSGCVGVRTYQLSGSSREVSNEESAQALTGKSVSLTLLDGTIHKGLITHLGADFVTLRLEEKNDTLIARRESIYAVSIARCLPCWMAGAAVGGVIGGLAAPKPTHIYELGGLGYGIGGMFLGGTLVAIFTPPKRYVVGQALELLDTLRVDKKDVISNTGEQITVRQAQESTTYDKRLVKIITHHDFVFVIRPAPSLIRRVQAIPLP